MMQQQMYDMQPEQQQERDPEVPKNPLQSSFAVQHINKAEVDAAAAAGITAVIQPGGSVRDGEVIQAADDAGMAMLFTGIRHFKH